MKKYLGTTLYFAAFLALVDQLTKYAVVIFLHKDLPILGQFFSLRYSENPGIAFGIDLPVWLLTFGGIALLCSVMYLATKEFDLKHPLTQTSLALLLGGGLGNLIDRFSRGFVVDFISIWKWPIFNFADIFVTVGVLLIIVFYGKIKREQR